MSLYKPKPARLNAVKIEKILVANPVNLPAWASEALLSGAVIKLPNASVVVTTLQGKRAGTANDMLVKSMIGDLFIVSKADFLAEYELV
jgi:phage tail protein X